jgi:hypothetical protein
VNNLTDSSRQARKHYRENRLRMRERKCAKFARMRAAKERLRMEPAAAVEDEPKAPVHREPAPQPMVEVRVRVGDRWFCRSAHEAPWGGMHPSKTQLLKFVRSALKLA